MADHVMLILVAPLFFLAELALLYAGAGLIAAGLLRVRGGWLPARRAKRLLLVLLVVPPLLAGIPLLTGALLHQMEALPGTVHHSALCAYLFTRVFPIGDVPHVAVAPMAMVAVTLLAGLTWVLSLAGLIATARLIIRSRRLAWGLEAVSRPAGARLASAVARVSERMPGLRVETFREADIPADRSGLMGCWRVRGILSRALIQEATEEELEAVVAHEAAHLRAGDACRTFLVAVLEQLFFFLGPVRLLGRWWREEAEVASDAAAVDATGRPLTMAAALLRVAGAGVSSPAGTARLAGSGSAAPGTLATREQARRVEDLIARAQRPFAPEGADSRLHLVLAWAATTVIGAFGLWLLLSEQAACTTHCALQAAARLLG